MRWLLDEVPGSPEHNMAADAALLAAQAGNGNEPPTVRVYTWDRQAVSIGRLQREGPVRALYPELPIVRRPTGGRAAVHGKDLTIAVAVRLDRLPPESRSVLSSHHVLMGAVQSALGAAGVESCFGGCAIGSQSSIVNCFELSAACDLIDSHTGTKIVGSAQRREGEALLQQMSLPLCFLTDQDLFLECLQAQFSQTFCTSGFNDPEFAV